MTPECPYCGNERIVVEGRGDHLIARPCACQRPCPTCADVGFVFRDDAQGYARAEPCACREVERRARLLTEATLPARYGRARLETFETREPWQANALNVAYGFAREFEPGARGLLFYGRSGTGKTHLSVALLRFLLVQRGVRARFVEFSHLISDLREAFSGKNAATTLMSPLTEVPLLVIDELGKGARREWEQDVLDDLVSRRYNAKRTTIFTTNYLVAGRGVPEDSLEHRVGARIYSRLAEMCRAHVMNGEDQRRIPESPALHRG